MAEQLLIRLGSQASDQIHWLIWSTTEQHIIASGELAGAEHLSALQEKSTSRQVITIVPSSDVALKTLTVPAKSKKAIQLAAPYMLEDELAQEVENLFFAYGDHKQVGIEQNCVVVAVERQHILVWLSWLSHAGISTKHMIPDVFLMPKADEHWQAIQIDEHVLLRQGAWSGTLIDASLWTQLSEFWKNENIIDTYSLLPETGKDVVIDAQPEELPLALFAQNYTNNAFNLLQGEFKVKTKRSPVLKTWAWAAGLIVCALLINVLMKSLTLMKINQQQLAIEQQIIEEYQSAFPETKRVRISTIRSQLKRKMAGVGSNSNQSEFLSLLVELEPVFKKVPSMKPDSIKYDSKRDELRLQAIANDYQQFEQFKVMLESKGLSVTQGTQNNQGEKVSGSFSIKYKKGAQS